MRLKRKRNSRIQAEEYHGTTSSIGPLKMSGFLRRQLLEFEGGDEFGVDAVLETFREQGVDGHALLNLDDEQLRYELDVGVVGMRESILRIVDALKRGVEHSEAQQRLLSSTFQVESGDSSGETRDAPSTHGPARCAKQRQ